MGGPLYPPRAKGAGILGEPCAGAGRRVQRRPEGFPLNGPVAVTMRGETMTRGTAESYRTFTRTWWRRNPDWPGRREPGAGRPRTHARNLTEAEARHICRDWNATHDPGFLSRKMEYDRE